jgi:hypothetical protein
MFLCLFIICKVIRVCVMLYDSMESIRLYLRDNDRCSNYFVNSNRLDSFDYTGSINILRISRLLAIHLWRDKCYLVSILKGVSSLSLRPPTFSSGFVGRHGRNSRNKWVSWLFVGAKIRVITATANILGEFKAIIATSPTTSCHIAQVAPDSTVAYVTD